MSTPTPTAHRAARAARAARDARDLPACTVTSLDHLVLTVASIPASVAWYTLHLGMHHHVFGGGGNVQRHALTFGTSKINLHELHHEFEPKAAHVQTGSADLCFLTPEKVEDVLERLRVGGLEILEGGGVVDRTGAAGRLRSVYVRDPDGNLIE